MVRVKAAFFSLTPPAPPDDDGSYLRWHLLHDDPRLTTKALTPLIEERWQSGAAQPLFAGPLRTMIDWEVWR